MRAMILMFSCFVVCFGGLVDDLSVAHAQSLPDLMVTNIACRTTDGNVEFTVRNVSHYPLPTGWKAVADVYFGTTKKGTIDLRYPTSGSIVQGGGIANYATKIYIRYDSTKVKVVVDPLNTVKEWLETNNSTTQTLNCCRPSASLDY